MTPRDPLSDAERSIRMQNLVKNQPVNLSSIKVGGHSMTILRIELPIEDGRFDRKNRRVYSKLKNVNFSDEALEETLYDKSLANQIKENNGLIEPLYIRVDGTVVEGNRRFAALRRLNREFPDNTNFSNIPVFLLPSDVDENDLKILLLNWHVSGKKEWQAFERASFIGDLVSDSNETDVANLLGKTKNDISKIVAAYELTSDYGQYVEDGLATGQLKLPKSKNKKQSYREKYSYFEETVKQRAKFSKLTYYKLKYGQNSNRFSEFDSATKRFHAWVEDEIFPLVQKEIIDHAYRDTREFADIMAYKGGAGELWRKLQSVKHISVILTEMEATHPEQGVEGSNYMKIKVATKALESLMGNSSELRLLKKGNKAKIQRFTDLKDILDRILSEINR